MGMCTVFWRDSAKVPFVSRDYSVRSFYLTGVLLSRLSSFRGIKADVSVSNGRARTKVVLVKVVS